MRRRNADDASGTMSAEYFIDNTEEATKAHQDVLMMGVAFVAEQGIECFGIN